MSPPRLVIDPKHVPMVEELVARKIGRSRIASELGVSETYVRTIQERFGIFSKQRITPEREAQVLELFQSGKSPYVIEAELGISNAAIYLLLEKNGLRGHRSASYEARKNNWEIFRFLYVDGGWSTFDIAKSFSCNQSQVESDLRSLGVPMNNGVQKWRRRPRKDFNHGAFAELDRPEVPYLIGYYFADGNTSGQRELTLIVAEADMPDLVAIFASVFQVPVDDVPVYRHREATATTQTTYAVRFNSERAVSRLRRYGMLSGREGKAANIRCLDPRLLENRFFWLGLFDGDGHIKARPARTPGLASALITLAGNPHLLGQFCEYIQGKWPEVSVKPAPYKGSVNLRTGYVCHSVTVCGKKAMELGRHLWGGHTIGLSRKRAVYEAMERYLSHYYDAFPHMNSKLQAVDVRRLGAMAAEMRLADGLPASW